MAYKACSSCKNLDSKNKSMGAVSGAKYFCKVKGCFVYGNDDECSAWKEDIVRKDYECDKIFEDGELYINDTKFVKSYHDCSCSSCKYLDSEKESKGSGGGAKYFCSKQKGSVRGNENACIDYEKDVLRDNNKCDKIFEDGEKYYNDEHSEGYYLFILVVIIIILIIALITNSDLYF